MPTEGPPQPALDAPLLCKGLPRRKHWRQFLYSDVDPAYATAPLAVFCFMTGFM
jgi:hypothetical protein